jgi:histidinol-phosphate aminotransferase
MHTRTDVDLLHHGDAELAPGLIDLAVNVRHGAPPAWLREELASSLSYLAAYPRDDQARAAIAARHGRDPDEVLVTAGAAEAFTLVARALRPRHAVVVHPQFTEPEAALRAAGHDVDRVLLRREDGFQLGPATVPVSADLVVIGNPTNPTSVLHPARDVRVLARSGRLVVVDEAFMDAVPGEPESLASESLPGMLVVRSLTKTWGLAGLRVGYLLGPPELLRGLCDAQPPWAVSTPALVAARACSTGRALAEAAAAADQLVRHRATLVDLLTSVPGVDVVRPAWAPFVLVRVANGLAVRDALRRKGFAVRRGDTFPGLGPEWLRVAVRAPRVSVAFVTALGEVLTGVRPSAQPATSPTRLGNTAAE